MKSVTIAEFKRRLPELLAEVEAGSTILVQRGRKRERVAVLAPCPVEDPAPRRLGLLAKRGKPEFRDWAMDEESFLASR